MNSRYIFYVTLFTSVLLSACSSRQAPAPVSSLNTSVKPYTSKVNINGDRYVVKKAIHFTQSLSAPNKIFACWQKTMIFQLLT